MHHRHHRQPADVVGRAGRSMQWTTCPECGAVAEIRHRTVLPSTASPVEHVGVLCLARHTFLMPVDVLDPVLPTGSR